MSLLKKILQSKLGSTFNKRGGSEKDDSSLMDKADVNEEYKEAFRTKSYTEMCNKVQGHIEITMKNFDRAGQSFSPSSSSHSPPPPPIRLHEHLIEPRQETLISITSNHQNYIDNFFEVSLEVSKVCESLLKSIHQLRRNHHLLKNVIRLIEQVPDVSKWNHNQYKSAYNSLVTFGLRANPFSSASPENFRQLHDKHAVLFRDLTSQSKRKKRRTKFVRCIKKAVETSLAVGFGALAVALIVLTILHLSIGGLVAAIGLLVGSLGTFIVKKTNQAEEKLRKDRLEGEQLDVAARGVYIMVNDFDTIGRLVQRLKNEMEHRKFVSNICVRKWKSEMVKEVSKEFQMQELCIMEQIEELEKQIYLCFLNINRSRRLVVQEMAKY